MDSVRVAAEERMKILKEESKMNQQKAQFEDELARRRLVIRFKLNGAKM